MALSKKFNKSFCKLCAIRHLRAYHPENVPNLNQKLAAHWKLVNYVQNYVSKLPTQNVHLKFKRDFLEFFGKIEPFYDNYRKVVSLSSFPVKKVHSEASPKAVKNSNGKILKEVVMSREAIKSRSRQLLMVLSDAKSEQMKLSRLRDINNYLNQYAEAKHSLVKEGAIRSLLKFRQNSKNLELLENLRETLGLLGYIDPTTGTGIKILSIDGGGIRGIVVLEMLKKLEEITQKPISETFDFICGVSTGAIIASLISSKKYSLDEIMLIYKELSIEIFTQSALKGTSNLVWSHSYYNTELWEKLLKSQIGDRTLLSTSRLDKSPKLCILSTIVNQTPLSAYVFRNYTFPCNIQSHYFGDHKHLIWEAVRASAAAPTYFEEFKLNNRILQDGGILFNNPTSVAIHEAKLLWPQTPIQCVISIGTGRSIPTSEQNIEISPKTLSWKDKFLAIIESATDTEGVHSTLSDLLPCTVYYRFNPYLTEMLNISEIDNKKLEQLERDVLMYLRRNEDKFKQAAKVLSVEKSKYQKSLEWIHLQKEISGFKLV